MLELEQHPDGVILPIQAHPKARKNAITGIHAGRLKVAVTQAPEKGKANVAILKLLAKQLELKRSQLSLESGATSPQKKILVHGIQKTQLEKLINACIAPSAE